MMSRLSVERSGLRLISRGDMGVWLAPRKDGQGTVSVLRFSTVTGQAFAVALTGADVERLRDTAGAILAATPGDIEDWLDRAADVIATAAIEQGVQTGDDANDLSLG